MKTTLCGIALMTALSMTSCTSDAFYAVSDTSGKDGGILRIQNRKQTAFFPVRHLNYLIRGAHPGIYYGTVSAMPDGKKGGVVTLRTGKNGNLEIAAYTPVNGLVPCHLALSPDGRFLYTANYSSADLTQLPVAPDGIPHEGIRIPHEGKGSTPRQEKAHPHFVGFHPADGELYAADLGLDEIRIYSYLPGKGILLPAKERLKLPAGAGPRHLVFSAGGNRLYAANELDSTVTSFLRENGAWIRKETISTLKSPSQVRNYPGAIRITRDGRFLFVSNRGDDSIALLEQNPDGSLKLLDTVPCGGKFPRDMQLSPDETLLAVANEKSGTVSFLRFDPDRKRLTPLTETLPAPRALGILY